MNECSVVAILLADHDTVADGTDTSGRLQYLEVTDPRVQHVVEPATETLGLKHIGGNTLSS